MNMSIATLLSSDPAPEIVGQPLRAKLKVAIAGMGAVGAALVRQLSHGEVPGVEIVGITVRNKAKARATLDAMGA